MGLLDAGCPVARHDLRDEDWLMIGLLSKERDLIIAEETAKK